MAPVALAAVGATAGYAFAGTAAATAMGVTMGQAMFAGASLGMMAGG